ncbi:MAG: response regulator transcription factor [Bacteroidota bacterium]
MPSLFVVDDHPITREGYLRLFAGVPALEVVGTTGNGATAFELIQEANPDLVVVDLNLPDMHGLELIKRLRALRPEMGILVVSIHDERRYAERVLRAGAQGYVMKEVAASTILNAVETVLSGRTYYSDSLRQYLIERTLDGEEVMLPTSRLTDRELEAFELLGQGLATREVAERMQVSAKTVDSYRESIKTKLGLKHANELVQRAALFRQQELRRNTASE